MPDTTRREFVALIGGGGLLLTVKVRRARGSGVCLWIAIVRQSLTAAIDDVRVAPEAQRSSSAVATSREGHCSPSSGRGSPAPTTGPGNRDDVTRCVSALSRWPPSSELPL
jgi:hypothetical protein